MVREVSLVGQTPTSAPDPLVRLFHDAQDRPTRASAADQGVCPTMRIYSMNYGDRRLVACLLLSLRQESPGFRVCGKTPELVKSPRRSTRSTNVRPTPLQSSLSGLTRPRHVSTPSTRNTAVIPSAVGINSMRFDLASSRRFSPIQVNCTSTRCPRPMVRQCVSSSDVNGEFFNASTCGARRSAAFLSASRCSRSRFTRLRVLLLQPLQGIQIVFQIIEETHTFSIAVEWTFLTP